MDLGLVSHNCLLQRNNRLVWEESLKITEDLLNTVWKNEDVVEVEHAVDVTLSVSASCNDSSTTLIKAV